MLLTLEKKNGRRRAQYNFQINEQEVKFIVNVQFNKKIIFHAKEH